MKFNRREALRAGLLTSLSIASSAVLPFAAGCRKRASGVERPNILWISLDTTRRDHLGCYGYELPTSPNIDALAAESLVYTQAISPSSWTLPAHASMFTGKFLASHGARKDPEGPLVLTSVISGHKEYERYRARGISSEEVTLADLLKQAGYDTAGVVAGPWLKKAFGLGAGFDFYDDARIDSLDGRLAQSVTNSALAWLQQQQQSQNPFFLFLNYFDPHTPWTPSPLFLRPFATPEIMQGDPWLLEIAKYDAEILYMDVSIGMLLKQLKASGQYDHTMIIVTADHGELLGEHGLHGHGAYLTQEEIHIPFIVKEPRGEREPARLSTRVQLVDILPTICERLNLSLPSGVQGTSLENMAHPVIAEVYPYGFNSEDGDWQVIYDGDHKLAWNSKGSHKLFNLRTDPAENYNVLEREPELAQSLMKKLKDYLGSLPKPPKIDQGDIQIDEETLRTLKSMGYVQ
jgi:arylsulfatase A-like enzyme